MERLTDRRTSEALKANAEKLRAAGLEPSEMDKRYIKLAEYEDAEEEVENSVFFNDSGKGYHSIAVANAFSEKVFRNEVKRMKDKVKYEKPKLYYCDPAKHSQRRAIACYVNGGCCELTQHKEFARIDENGKYMEYKEGD